MQDIRIATDPPDVLRERLQAELDQEIAFALTRMQEKDAEIARAEGSEIFNLGAVLRLKSEKLELASYLKGLRFCASKVGKL